MVPAGIFSLRNLKGPAAAPGASGGVAPWNQGVSTPSCSVPTLPHLIFPSNPHSVTPSTEESAWVAAGFAGAFAEASHVPMQWRNFRPAMERRPFETAGEG